MKNKLIVSAFVSALLLSGCSSFGGQSSQKDMMDSKDRMSETSDSMKKDEKMMDKDSEMKKDDQMMDKDSDMKKEDEMKKESSMHEDKEMMKDGEKMNEGEMAPDFSLKGVDGNTYTLSEYKGKKVYVEFWASWCSICLSTLPSIDELSQMNDQDFEVLTIVTPGKNGEKNTEDFKKWFSGLEYKNLKVLLDEDGTVTESFGVRAHPTSVFIGSDGVLVKTQPGFVSKDDIQSTLQQLK